MNEVSLNKLHNKIDKLKADCNISRNTTQQIKSDSDKRYKKYTEYIKSIEALEAINKAYIKKISMHTIILYIMLTTILAKVW